MKYEEHRALLDEIERKMKLFQAFKLAFYMVSLTVLLILLIMRYPLY